MASPSRSSSVARYSSLASLRAALRSLMTCLPRSVSSYVGLKPLSTSTASPFDGRSATWPTEARTSKALPRNFEIVLAFAGDSTTTNGLAIGPSSLRDGRIPCQGHHGGAPAELLGRSAFDRWRPRRALVPWA